jgi:Uma2 family endonuclease
MNPPSPAQNSSPERRPMTVEDYLAMPDDEKRYELIEGELEMIPAPFTPHQSVALNLATELLTKLQRTGRGRVFIAPVDVILAPRTCVQPDVVFIGKERGEIVQNQVRGAPDLAVEVLSQWSRRRDLVKKRRLYARYGIPHYWVVDPDGDRIEFFQLVGEDYHLVVEAAAPAVIEPPGFPGLSLDLKDIFAG